MSANGEQIREGLDMMKQKIKDFVLGLGVDDAGVAAVSSYNSPRSPQIESIFPEAKSIIVLAYRGDDE